MPDFSLCANGDTCPKRETCRRYRAIPSARWQSYANYFVLGEDCASYWPLETPRRKRRAMPKGDGASTKGGMG